VSRREGDAIAATIVECELVNPNPSGASFAGPFAAACSSSRST
jgi:hypothetical protein